MTLALTALLAVCLNGSWEFAFHEDKLIEDFSEKDFKATDTMTVPGCWDVCPKWYLKHGTGLYRRTFTTDAAMKDAVLEVEGMGLRVRFFVDGRDLGTYAYPYAKLEISVGALAAGEHTIFAEVDNVMGWPRVKLARPYYDFYFYGGFYHGMRIVERTPKVFVRTLDYATGEIEVEVESEKVKGEGQGQERMLVFDGKNEVKATFKNGRAIVRVPDFKLWSPESPNLHTVALRDPSSNQTIKQSNNQTILSARFGLRQVEAKKGKIYLNGKELFLKGFNRHESFHLNGAATTDLLMMQDLQRLKALGGNFIRGAHYQQCRRFLELCDEMGVLVWEESLGWGNGQDYASGKKGAKFPPNELTDPEWCEMQVKQTRDMVRESFNHPSVIIYAFMNEPGSQKRECKVIVDRLIDTIKAENSGRLVTFACNIVDKDICNEKTDIIAFNAYPGTIPAAPGTPAEFEKKTKDRFNEIIRKFREKYPDKPIMVSESGCGGVYGVHDPNASPNTEEYQEEYLRYILEALWANPDCVGFSIWQMNDGRTRERFCSKAVSPMFGGSVAGCFDQMRRPKMSTATIKKFFMQK